MRGLVLDVIDVGCVFDDVVCGFLEVAENIVSRAVPSRTPAGLEAVLAHIHHAAHHLIDVGDEVSDMVKRSVRGATERDRMVFIITTQEDHLLFAPIGDPKAKYFCVKFYHRINLSCVKDDMTNGMKLHALGLSPASMLNDAGAQLDAAALRINESKSISSPRLVQGLRLRY
jgi:hypothetical protein